jgi:CTP:molybdopterin cytidylyltransferase MocA
VRRVLIIPAAGSGSRLGAPVPKLLFPVNRRPMLDYLVALYAPFVERLVLVVQPAAESQVREYCAAHGIRAECEVQPSPTGMLDAILIPSDRIARAAPDTVWITWCDQIAVHPSTVARLAEADGASDLVFPTVRQVQPYVHFVRNDRGDLSGVLHRREGDAMPDVGESDIGLFALTRTTYLGLLPAFACEAGRSAVTRERNFLPFIPWLAARGRVATIPAQAEIEALGLNTADDARRLEAHFSGRAPTASRRDG